MHAWRERILFTEGYREMKLRAVSGIVQILLFIGMLTLAFNIQPVKAKYRTWTVDDDGGFKEKVVMLVPNGIYLQLKERLERYVSDISDFEVMIRNGSWSDPSEVRTEIQAVYSAYNTCGCILVGDVPIAYYKTGETPYGVLTFPTDLYYMDLNGLWTDVNYDWIFENRSDPDGIEIWVSRIKAPTENLTLLKSYFDKNHDFHSGLLGDYRKALAYIKDCEFGQEHRIEILKSIYNETDIVFLCGENATEEEYLETLRQGFETVWISCHGGPTRQLIEEEPVVWFDGNDAKSIDVGSIFYLLHSCEVGRYDVENYLAGWYVFGNSNGLIALASTTLWESIDHDLFIYENENSYVGKAFLRTIRHADEVAPIDPIVARNLYYGGVLIGDPLISITTTPPTPVGGISIPVDKLGLLAPYIALASTILIATAATAIYVKRVKRRKEKQ